MRTLATAPHPPCHLAHIPAPGRAGSLAAVWVCEYPYRTIRASGPSADCADCPVWREMERTRGHRAHLDGDVEITVKIDMDGVEIETGAY